jgi:hypothetical protein
LKPFCEFFSVRFLQEPAMSASAEVSRQRRATASAPAAKGPTREGGRHLQKFAWFSGGCGASKFEDA